MTTAYVPQQQFGRGTTLTFTPVGVGSTALTFPSLEAVTPPGVAVGEAETTLLTNNFKPYAPILPEGEGTFTVQHWDNDPGCVGMQVAVRVAPVPFGVFLITLPSLATISFTGFPKGYAIGEVTNEETITAEIPYRCTTPPVYTAAPSTS